MPSNASMNSLHIKGHIMARFATLCSSSKGNSAYIGTAEHGILVDAGSSAKQLEAGLTKLQLDPAKIDAIFVQKNRKKFRFSY